MSTKTRQNSRATRPTLEMLIDLTRTIMAVLARLSFEQVQNLLENKNIILRKKLEMVFEVVAVDPFVDIRTEWKKFYKDHFGIVVDFSEVAIPPKLSEGSWRLLFIPTGLTLNATIAAMRKLFKVWVYNEKLDENITLNTRTSVTSYAVWVRDGVELDDKYLGKSTRDADMAGTIGMTLLERLVLEVKYFTETGKHLDEKGVTFCTGSRSSDGNVPGVYFSPSTGSVLVRWFSVVDAYSASGLREAVSL